jgi:hypothetical protein
LIGLSFIGYHDGTWRPGPWLLGGLIPFFVGLAQIMGAILSGASFPRPDPSRMTPPPQPPPPPGGPFEQPAAGTPGGSAYRYRPGDVGELPQSPPPPMRQ